MGTVGAYILLGTSASRRARPLAAVWQALSDSVFGVLALLGGAVRVTVVAFADTARVLLDGVSPQEVLEAETPQVETGLSNLNLALLGCLSLLNRAPPGEKPLLVLVSDGIVTDDSTALSRRWGRMTEGIPKYVLLTGPPLPGVPLQAFGAPANQVYGMDGAELDRLSRDLGEDLSLLSRPRPRLFPAPEESDEHNFNHQMTTKMENIPTLPQMPYAVPDSANMSLQGMLRCINIYDDQVTAGLTKDRSFFSRLFPTVEDKLTKEYKGKLLELGFKKSEKAYALAGDLWLRAFAEWGDYQLIQAKALYRSDTAMRLMSIYQKVIIPFSESRNALLLRLEQDFARCEQVTNTYLRQQFEKSLQDTTVQLFDLYHRLGLYLAGILDGNLQTPAPLNP